MIKLVRYLFFFIILIGSTNSILSILHQIDPEGETCINPNIKVLCVRDENNRHYKATIAIKTGSIPKITHMTTDKKVTHFILTGNELTKDSLFGLIDEDNLCHIGNFYNNIVRQVQAAKSKRIIACRPENNSMYVCYQDNSIDIFDTESGKRRSTLQADQSKPIVFCHSENIVAYMSEKNVMYVYYQDNTIDTFDINTGQKVSTLQANKNKQIKTLKEGTCGFIHIWYQDNTIDIFSNFSFLSRKVNTIQPDLKRPFKDWRAGKKFTYIWYHDNTIDIFRNDSGQQITTLWPNPNKQIEALNTEKSISFYLYQDRTMVMNTKTPHFFSNQDKTIDKWKDEDMMCVLYRDKTIDIFSIDPVQRICTFQSDQSKEINSLEVNKNIIYILYRDGTVDLFNISLSRTLQADFSRRTNSLEMQKDTIGIYYYGSHEIDRFTINSCQKLGTIQTNRNKTIDILEMNKNITYIRYQDKTIDVFRNLSQKISVQSDQDKRIEAWNIENNIFYTWYSDNTIDLFNMNSGQKISIQPNQNKSFDAWNIENNKLYFWYQDSTIDIYNMESGQKISTIEYNRSKQFRSWDIRDNMLYIRYQDGIRDVFDIHSGLKLSLLSNKKRKRVEEEDPEDHPNKRRKYNS